MYSLASFADAFWARHTIALPYERRLKHRVIHFAKSDSTPPDQGSELWTQRNFARDLFNRVAFQRVRLTEQEAVLYLVKKGMEVFERTHSFG